MKVLKIIGVILLVIIVVVAILAFVAPTQMKTERSVKIDAPKELVYDYLLYFEKSNQWSPWMKLDTNMETRIEGEDGAVGTSFHWEGNEQAGKGKQEIISADEDLIEHKITFVEPFESTADTYFKIEEEEEGNVEVSWGFESEMTRPLNIMGLFFNMEEAIGKDYEKGLESLKELVEKAKQEAVEKATSYQIETVNFEETNYLTFRDRIAFADMQKFYSENLGAIFQMLSNNPSTEVAGAASGIYYDWDEENMEAELAAAVPFTSTEEVDFDKYTVVTLSGNALKIAYFGDYEKLGDAHEAIHQHLEENNLPMSNTVLEEYITDPSQEPDTSKWLTNIYYFIEE